MKYECMYYVVIHLGRQIQKEKGKCKFYVHGIKLSELERRREDEKAKALK